MIKDCIPDKEDKEKVEKHFIEICIRDGIKYNSKKYLEWQRMYFCGAMTITHHIFQFWSICIAANRPIIHKEDYK